MVFAPSPTPKGYSYLEDAPGDFQRWLGKNGPPSGDAVTIAVREYILDEILKRKYARHATTFVQKGVGAFHKTPSGKFLINKVASVSLNKSVEGAAAISHVSKIIRTHGISNFGVMVYNDGRLLFRYCNGDVNGAELDKELFGETMGQCGNMLEWMVGASIAASFVCAPFAAAAIAMAGSMAGRVIGQSVARVAMKA